jgi:hypothetical protein
MKYLLFLGQVSLLMHSIMAMANFPSACLYNPVELEAGISIVTMK